MAEPDRRRSPFAGMADLSARTPTRVLSPDEIERMLAEHRLYLETEYHQGPPRRSDPAPMSRATRSAPVGRISRKAAWTSSLRSCS